MDQKKRIVFTGGGTAGHVTPNIALIEKLQGEGWDVHYIGSHAGMEKDLIGKIPGVTYHGVSAGKLRRYASLQNLLDPFRVLKGLKESRALIKNLHPDVVFSKGGYVSVPVVMASGKTPVVAHESDFTPGLANRIASHFTNRICVTFEDTLTQVPGNKGVYTGTPIRPELYAGDAARARAFTGLSGAKPVLLVMGGSSGAQRVNELLREALPLLLPRFDVIHLCGYGKLDASLHRDGYVQYEYINEELPDLMALADVVLSRAGANAVFELLALNKPALLIPLPKTKVSRGDQIQNATYFEKKGYAMQLDQDAATPERIAAMLGRLYDNRMTFIRTMEADTRSDGTDTILRIIHETVDV